MARILSRFRAVSRVSQAVEPLSVQLRVCVGQNVLRYAIRLPESGETIGKPKSLGDLFDGMSI